MSKPGTPVICLETEERFESMKEAMERYGVSSGSLNSALTYGYSTGGYHFYRADEPKPDDSFFKSGNGGKGSSKKRPVICLETGNGAHHRHPTGWRNLPPQANRGN